MGGHADAVSIFSSDKIVLLFFDETAAGLLTTMSLLSGLILLFPGVTTDRGVGSALDLRALFKDEDDIYLQLRFYIYITLSYLITKLAS